MNDISEIFNVDPNSWIDSLNTYQKNIISQLYAQTNDYEVVANKWLTATIPTNAPFGTEKNPSIFFEKVFAPSFFQQKKATSPMKEPLLF